MEQYLLSKTNKLCKLLKKEFNYWTPFYYHHILWILYPTKS